MSNHWLPRTPAFAGLHPAPARFDPADEATALWLQEQTHLAGEVARLRTSAKAPYGHFRLLGPNGSYFLKVLSPEEARHHQWADSIALCARCGGAAVALPEAWIETTDGPCIGIYTYIEGRYGNPTNEDASNLGGAIARLHRALRDCGEAKEVRRVSAERMRILARRRKEILSERGPGGPDPTGLRDLLSREKEPFEEPQDGQIVHGDLNLANVLFDMRTGLPTIIDFETATVSWLPPRIDVAMALQRLCLVASCGDDRKAAAAQALLAAYEDVSGEAPLSSYSQFVATLRWISMRNLCLLAEMEDQGKSVLPSEWQKFLVLGGAAEESARCLAPLFPFRP